MSAGIGPGVTRMKPAPAQPAPAVDANGYTTPCVNGHERPLWYLDGGFVNDCLLCEPPSTAFVTAIGELAASIVARRAAEGRALA